MHAEVLTKAIGYEVGRHGHLDGRAHRDQRLPDEAAAWTPARCARWTAPGCPGWTAVPAGQFAELLVAVRDKPWFAGLVRGAADRRATRTGSSAARCARRMCGTPAAGNAHGKTGSLTGVSGALRLCHRRRRPRAGLQHPAQQLPRSAGWRTSRTPSWSPWPPRRETAPWPPHTRTRTGPHGPARRAVTAWSAPGASRSAADRGLRLKRGPLSAGSFPDATRASEWAGGSPGRSGGPAVPRGLEPTGPRSAGRAGLVRSRPNPASAVSRASAEAPAGIAGSTR